MPRGRRIQTNFTAGELSPRLHSRVDFEKYFAGLETLENFIIFPHGGISRRPGTKFVAEVKDSTKKTRLIPFEFSDEETYVLEFGDQYFRIYKDGGRIESPPGTPVEVSTSYVEADLFALQFAQSADVMWVTHPSYKPQKITRTSDTSWLINNYAPTSDPFTSANNYPRGVALWQSRLWFVGTNNEPDTIWGSKVDDFEDMSLGTGADDDAIKRTLAAPKVNVLRWVQANRILLASSNGGEISISGGSRKAATTPTNISSNDETTLGTASISPTLAKGRTVFVQKLGKTALGQKIHALRYDFDIDGYLTDELTLLSEHIVQPSITQISYQQEPNSILWAVRSDGTILSLTYFPEQEVVGWARHTTQGLFESVASIPGTTGDVTYVIVNRTIGGATKRYVEFFEENGGFYGQLGVDSGLTLTSGTPVTSVSGLDHLEGETVDIVADGAVEPQAVVASGAAALQNGGKVVEAGLHFESTAKSLIPELEAGGGGSSQNVPMSRPQVSLRLFESLGGTVNGLPIPTRGSSDPMDAPPPLKTGLERIENLGWGEDSGQVTIQQTQPLPLTVLALIGDIDVGEF